MKVHTVSIYCFEESKFTYLSNHLVRYIRIAYCFEESKFTYLSNTTLENKVPVDVLKNQNLHTSQTIRLSSGR